MRVTKKMVSEARRRAAREIDDWFAATDEELVRRLREIRPTQPTR